MTKIICRLCSRKVVLQTHLLESSKISLLFRSNLKTEITLKTDPVKCNTSSGYGHLRYLVIAPLVCVGLGTWQIFRLQGKLEIIETIKKRFFADPVHLSAIDFTSNTSKELEYTHVYVSGNFDHSKEMYVDFRQPQLEVAQNQWTLATGNISTRGNYGSHVITPFTIDPEEAGKLQLQSQNTGQSVKILVNRGWVSKNDVDPSKRPEGQVKGKVQVSGYLRADEKKFMNFLIQDNQKPGTYLFREVTNMAKRAGTQPIMIELDSESSVEGGPIGGQTLVKIYNKHAEYIATWYGLALFTGYLWYKHVYQARPFAKKMFFRK